MPDEIQSQMIDVMFSGGMDRKTSKHVVAQPKLTRLENRVFRGGLLARRPGCERVYGPGDDTDSARLGVHAALSTLRGGLIARDASHVLVWSESLDSFIPGGLTGISGGQIPAPSFMIGKTRAFGGNSFFYAPDIASDDSVRVLTWTQVNADGVRFDPYVAVLGVNGEQIMPATLLVAPTVSVWQGAGARVVRVTGGFLLAYSAGSSLKARLISSAAPSTLGPELTLETTDTYHHVDAIGLFNGTAVVVAIRTDGSGVRTVRALLVNAAGAVTNSATVATYAEAVSLSAAAARNYDRVYVGQCNEASVAIAYGIKNGSAQTTVRGAVYDTGLSVVTADAEIINIATAADANAGAIYGINITPGYVPAEFILAVNHASAAGARRVLQGPLTKALGWSRSYLPGNHILTGRVFKFGGGRMLYPLAGPGRVNTTAFGTDYVSPQSMGLVMDDGGFVVARFSQGQAFNFQGSGANNGRLHNSYNDTLNVTYVVSEKGQGGSAEKAVLSVVQMLPDYDVRPVRPNSIEHHGSSYYPASIPKQFDGRAMHEMGFTSYIDDFAVTPVVGGGTLEAGSYVCAVIPEWTDSAGELHQGAPYFRTVTLASVGRIAWTVGEIPLTDKPNVRNALYRSSVLSGVPSSTLYRLNTALPSSLTVTEGETAIETHEAIYTTGDIVESTAPPPHKHVAEHGRRLFLSGTTDGNVWHSTKYVERIAPRFNEDFTLSPTGRGGFAVATASMGGRLFLLCERNVEYVSGDGPDEAFNGSFSDPQEVTNETGCMAPQSVKVTPQGLMFQGERGAYLIGPDGASGYIGDPTGDLAGIISAVVHSPGTEETRVFQSLPDCELVYNKAYGEWGSNPERAAASAVLWDDSPTWVNTDQTQPSIYIEREGLASDNGEPIVSVVETAWLRLNTLSGFQRVWWVRLLATYQGASTITLEIGYDESKEYSEVVHHFTGDLSLTPGDPIPLRWKPANQRCRSVRFRITCDGGGDAPSAGCDLTGMTLELGVKRGLFKLKQVETLGSVATSGGA